MRSTGADVRSAHDLHGVPPACARALARLKDAGVRGSRRRATVIEAFFSGATHVTAEELAESLEGRGRYVSVATVYRTLAVLVEHRLARAHRFANGQSRFEPAADDRHVDHLVCTGCRAVIEFRETALEEIQAAVARRHGFQLRGRKLDLYGVCETCLRASGTGSTT